MSKAKQWLQDILAQSAIKNIDYGELENEKMLTEGGFGKLMTAYWKKGRKTVVCKRLKNYTRQNEELFMKEFVNEVKINQRLYYCENIIRFLAISQDPKTSEYILIQEYADGGNLREYLCKNCSTLSWHNRLQLACQITNGLSSLHDEGIVHRDLHSKNILVQNGIAKLADFGASKNLITNSYTQTDFFGIAPYVEPMCMHDYKYPRDKRSDIYSLGVILWEIANPLGKCAFYGHQQDPTILYAIKDGTRETPDPKTPTEYVSLYQQCWEGDPQKRPEADFILDSIEKMIGDCSLDINQTIFISPNNPSNSSESRDDLEETLCDIDMSLSMNNYNDKNSFTLITGLFQDPEVRHCKLVLDKFKKEKNIDIPIQDCCISLHQYYWDVDGLEYHLKNEYSLPHKDRFAFLNNVHSGLIRNKSFVNQQEECYMDVFEKATKFLVEKGYDINDHGYFTTPSLSCLIMEYQDGFKEPIIQRLQILLKYGARLNNHINSVEESPLREGYFYCATAFQTIFYFPNSRLIPILEVFLKNGSRFSSLGDEIDFILSTLEKKDEGDFEAIAQLLRKYDDAGISALMIGGLNIVHYVLKYCSIKFLNRLLENLLTLSKPEIIDEAIQNTDLHSKERACLKNWQGKKGKAKQLKLQLKFLHLDR
ncbi:10751_t:CDS:2 [Ambispora gerdemannii]|uniref:10751_t:CDS:1 n=1 Tax=Ambispora gerdemannii TaxID=144530 RepID=A0A9N9DBX3_9GLOM|nr:10751_t:CDS:2 [Ambispora gerdemannii]